jgi:hypothetical protein
MASIVGGGGAVGGPGAGSVTVGASVGATSVNVAVGAVVSSGSTAGVTVRSDPAVVHAPVKIKTNKISWRYLFNRITASFYEHTIISM